MKAARRAGRRVRPSTPGAYLRALPAASERPPQPFPRLVRLAALQDLFERRSDCDMSASDERERDELLEEFHAVQRALVAGADALRHRAMKIRAPGPSSPGEVVARRLSRADDLDADATALLAEYGRRMRSFPK